MYDWNDIKYKTVINDNNHTLFEESNHETALIVLYFDVDVKTFKSFS